MSSKTGSDLFIVDNSDEEWKVLNGLASRGWLEREDALHAFKAWMGYGKLGSVIEDTVRSLVNGLSRQGRLEAEGSMIRRVGGA